MARFLINFGDLLNSVWIAKIKDLPNELNAWICVSMAVSIHIAKFKTWPEYQWRGILLNLMLAKVIHYN